MKILIYDCEIARGIPPKKEPPEFGIEYCGGWRDFKGMGLSLISAFDLSTRTPSVYLPDNLREFQRLLDEADIVVGFNNHTFDDQLITHHGFVLEHRKSYDLLAEIWLAAGLSTTFAPHSHGGYGLNAMCLANLGRGKIGDGAGAPILWQRRELGRLVNYGLSDITLTAELLDCAMRGPLKHPFRPGDSLFIRHPESVIQLARI